MTEAMEKGKAAEQSCATALGIFGYRILEMNRRAGHLEIDILAERGRKAYAVEVRARAKGAPVNGMESITAEKRSRIERAARSVAGPEATTLFVSAVLINGVTSEIEIIDEGF